MRPPNFGSVWTSTSPHFGSSESECATIWGRQAGLKLKHGDDSLSTFPSVFCLPFTSLMSYRSSLNWLCPELCTPWFDKRLHAAENEYFTVLHAACFAIICLHASQCGCGKHCKCAASTLLLTFHPDARLWQRLTQGTRFIVSITLGVHLGTAAWVRQNVNTHDTLSDKLQEWVSKAPSASQGWSLTFIYPQTLNHKLNLSSTLWLAIQMFKTAQWYCRKTFQIWETELLTVFMAYSTDLNSLGTLFWFIFARTVAQKTAVELWHLSSLNTGVSLTLWWLLKAIFIVKPFVTSSVVFMRVILRMNCSFSLELPSKDLDWFKSSSGIQPAQISIKSVSASKSNLTPRLFPICVSPVSW